MTTTTWTAAHTTTATPDFAGFGLRVLRKIGHFIAVGAGVYAEQDSNFRGLDLNGNAVWARSNTH